MRNLGFSPNCITCSQIKVTVFCSLILFMIVSIYITLHDSVTICIIDDFTERNAQSHGQAVYEIICDKLNKERHIVECIHIDLNEESSHSKLNTVLKKLIDRDIDYLNMSFGANTYNQETYALLKQIGESGTIIIAAAGNYGEAICDYPAAYDLNCIISVGVADDNGSILAYSNYGNDVDIFVSFSNEINNLRGTSAACAKVTNVMVREKYSCIHGNIKNYFLKKADSYRSGNYVYLYINLDNMEEKNENITK